ncbi:hypothetical protein F5051DRAFT_426200 [Lentinula edodes]|nr:hypothetical protein F5051DRAFT_426200 [Lentinula edodes]
MDEFLTQITEPSQSCLLLGHIEMHSEYGRKQTPTVYGSNQFHAKWSYESEYVQGVNGYPTIVLGYPNEQHDMISNKATWSPAYTHGNQLPPAKSYSTTSSVLCKGWHPGYVEIGAFVEAEVELHLWKTPLTMHYNDVDFSGLGNGKHF